MFQSNKEGSSGNYSGAPGHDDGDGGHPDSVQAEGTESHPVEDRTCRRSVLKMFGAGGLTSLVPGSSHTGLGPAIPLTTEESLTHKVAAVPVIPSGQRAAFGYEMDRYETSTVRRSGAGQEFAATSFAGLYEPTIPERDRDVPTAPIAMIASPSLDVLPVVPPLNPLVTDGIDQLLVDYADQLLGNLGVGDETGNISWRRRPTKVGLDWGSFRGNGLNVIIKVMAGILDGDPPTGVLLNVARMKNVGSDVVIVTNALQWEVPEDANPDQITLVYGPDESGLFHQFWAQVALDELKLMLPLIEMTDEPPGDVEPEQPEQTERVLNEWGWVGFGREATGPIVSFAGNWRGKGETLRLRITLDEILDGELEGGLNDFELDIEGPGGSELIEPNPITGGTDLVPSGGSPTRNPSMSLGEPLFDGPASAHRNTQYEGEEGESWEVEFEIQETGEYVYRLSIDENATGTGKIRIQDWVTYQGEPAYKSSPLSPKTEAGEPTGLVLNRGIGLPPSVGARIRGKLEHDEFDTREATIQIRQLRADDRSEGLDNLNLQIKNPSGDRLIWNSAAAGRTELLPTGDRETSDSIRLGPPLFEGPASADSNRREDGQFWEVSFPIRETGEHTFALGWIGDSLTSFQFRVWDQER